MLVSRCALLFVGVLGAREDFEAVEPPVAQTVLGQHAGNSLAENLSAHTHLFRLFLEHRLVLDLLKATRIHGVVAVELLVRLAAGDCNVRRICHHDIVSRIDRLVIHRFVLAHQCNRDRARETAENALARINVVPCACERQGCLLAAAYVADSLRHAREKQLGRLVSDDASPDRHGV